MKPLACIACLLFLGACTSTAGTAASASLATAMECSVSTPEPLLTADGGTEAIAVGKDGSIYTSDFCSGDVFRILPDGSATTLASIPYGVDNSNCDIGTTLGVAVADDESVWVVAWSGVAESHGVWRIEQDGSMELAIPLPPEAAAIPNDIVFDPAGSLYITESKGGAIWKASPGGAAEVWLTTELLAPPEGQDFGANGIAYREGVIYAANFARGTILQVPIESDGSAGTPAVFATIAPHGEGLTGPDGLEFDAAGDLYTVTAGGAQMVRIPPSGEPEVVLDLASLGLTFPTGIGFAPSEGQAHVAYVSNPGAAEGEADVVKLNLCPGD
jgi:sugar lactone lactonase YvrE